MILLDDRLGLKFFKTSIKKSSRNRSQKKLEYMQKCFQNEVEIDATTHHKSMPKLVTQKIMKIIKNHVSLNCKIIKIHCIVKTSVF